MNTDGVLATILDFGDELQKLWHFAKSVEQHLTQRLHDMRQVGTSEGWWQEEYFTELVQGTFPRFLRYSVILSIYSITEGALTEICSFTQARKKIPFTVHDMRGSGLTQRSTYLSQALGESFSVPERLQQLTTVRHCIAHASGDLSHWNRRKSVEQAALALGLSIEHDRIVVPFDVCAPLAQTALDWLNNVVAVIDPKLWTVMPLPRP